MSTPLECRAGRRGRTWVVHVPEYGVYGHGRTLKAARESTVQGLSLVGVAAEVRLVPVTPELEALRSAESAYTAALGEAVAALALRRATVRDIALATGASVAQVRRVLAERSQVPKADPAAGPDVPGR
ncbi:hypothetical protein [Kitasatospora sp. NPDC090091]|uniref:hypothetical protein n=1 Tax=Kitasatospora sp. NPDC090091 TaxID=3364081 RepID=UPI0037FD4F97